MHVPSMCICELGKCHAFAVEGVTLLERYTTHNYFWTLGMVRCWLPLEQLVAGSRRTSFFLSTSYPTTGSSTSSSQPQPKQVNWSVRRLSSIIYNLPEISFSSDVNMRNITKKRDLHRYLSLPLSIHINISISIYVSPLWKSWSFSYFVINLNKLHF